MTSKVKGGGEIFVGGLSQEIWSQAQKAYCQDLAAIEGTGSWLFLQDKKDVVEASQVVYNVVVETAVSAGQENSTFSEPFQ